MKIYGWEDALGLKVGYFEFLLPMLVVGPAKAAGNTIDNQG